MVQPRGGSVRRRRQQQGGGASTVIDVGLVDAGIGAHQAQPIAGDQHTGGRAHHLGGLLEDELHQPRILAGLGA